MRAGGRPVRSRKGWYFAKNTLDARAFAGRDMGVELRRDVSHMAPTVESSLPGKPVLKRRHVAAATIGNALEFFDFLTYAFFSIQIGHAFFPAESAYASLMLSLATFGAGFVTRPIGAVVIGNYADRVGRRPAMMLCFLMIGLAIVSMALTPSYATIGIAAPILAVVARMVQGFSLGGEVGTNTAYLLEASPDADRGLIVSWQAASQYLALIAGGLVGVVLTDVMPAPLLDAYGWRIAFLLGASVVPFGLWLRANLPETLHAPEPVVETTEVRQSRLRLAWAHWRVMLLGFVVLASQTIGWYIFVYIVTYAQATLHMTANAGFIATTCCNVISIPATLVAGKMSDRYGRWPLNVWGTLLFLVLIYPLFLWIAATRSEFALIAGVTLLGATSAFGSGAFLAQLVESLPKPIRGTAMGTVYSVSIAAFGGTTQLVVTWLIHVTDSAMAPAWYLTGVTALGLIALMLMKESAPVRVSQGALAAAVAAG